MPSTNETTRLLKTLASQIELWQPPKPWAVGYSGGRDSAVLLWALSQLVPPGELFALHVDHGWRPADERRAEATIVEAWSGRLGVGLGTFRPSTDGERTEASARRHRFDCFQTFIEGNSGGTVFLAHHADDQAETVLMRLLKGRSWQGLAGMAVRRGPYFRPFLGLRGQVLGAVAEEQRVLFHQDSTNGDSRWIRNHLRREVFPILARRFPTAVEALNSFAQGWANWGPSSALDPEWILEVSGAHLPLSVWESWNPWVREAQLLAVATRGGERVRLGRRFLETACRQGRRSACRGAGWVWRIVGAEVRWNRVVQEAPKEYFVYAQKGEIYDLGGYRFRWGTDDRDGQDNLFVPGIDPRLPLVWRSAVPGMVLTTAEEGTWTRPQRHRRMGSLSPDRCALLWQDGFLKAAVDPTQRTLLWAVSGPDKLKRDGIFVTLEQRSDYERR